MKKSKKRASKKTRVSLKTRVYENKYVRPYRPSIIKEDAQRDYDAFKERLEKGESLSTVKTGFRKHLLITSLWIFAALMLMFLLTILF